MELFHLSDLLVSLTVIISCTSSEGDSFDENKLNVLARITTCVIVSFPKVASPFRDNVKRSILEAVIRVGLFNTAIFNSYLEKFGQ